MRRHPDDSARFATLTGRGRIWAVAAVHAETAHLAAIHTVLEKRLRPGDAVVYLGNVIGRRGGTREVLSELFSFRRAIIARPGSFAADIVYLRGGQEELWSRLQELHFAPQPVQALDWMFGQGIGQLLADYGLDYRDAVSAARQGAVVLARWTGALRAAINAAPGHRAWLATLRRAVWTQDGRLLFVHAGIDPARSLLAQNDRFWWEGDGLMDLDRPFESFQRVIRGYDRRHADLGRAGIRQTPFAVSLDGGCGFGGALIAGCFAPDGTLVEAYEG